MSDAINTMELLLSEELKLHEQLVHCATDMRNAIKRKDIEAVKQNTARIDNTVEQLDCLERKRHEVAATIVQGRPVHFQAILGCAPERKKAALMKLRTAIRKTMAALKGIVVSNQILLQESLNGIRFSVSVGTTVPGSETGYGAKGAAQPDLSRRSLVNRLA